MSAGGAPGPLRYLDSAAVAACLPPVPELLDLAGLALRSLVAGAQVPPKAALPPDADGVFAHAMPARLVGSAVPGGGAAGDLLGMKWIAGGPGNRAAGLPALSALICVSDPRTGVPLAVMDGGVITAWRTAALSGAAARLLARAAPGRAPRAVLVGAGAQARTHAAILGTVLPGVELAIHDRHPERAAALAAEAATSPGVGSAASVADPLGACREADVIVSATSVGRSEPVLRAGDVGADTLVIPVDYGAWVRAELVRSATTVAVDERTTYDANRASGRLEGWPEATAMLGELLLEGRGDGPSASTRPTGIAVALHQGPAVADLLVADAVLRRAIAAGAGSDLSR